MNSYFTETYKSYMVIVMFENSSQEFIVSAQNKLNAISAVASEVSGNFTCKCQLLIN